MSLDPGRLVILDTNVLVHLVRNNDIGRAIEAKYRLLERVERPLVSTVAEGELLGLATRWGWEERRLRALRALLDHLVPIEAGMPEIIHAYAALYAETARSGRALGQNDLWIAATTQVFRAQLLTCDRDFVWLDPRHITVCYISESD